jgi:hypothetical protein
MRKMKFTVNIYTQILNTITSQYMNISMNKYTNILALSFSR